VKNEPSTNVGFGRMNDTSLVFIENDILGYDNMLNVTLSNPLKSATPPCEKCK
jgi:hypothetical protein